MHGSCLPVSVQPTLDILVDGEPEVGDVRMTGFVQQDVRRFEVPVHQTRAVCVGNGFQNLDQPLCRFVASDRTAVDSLAARFWPGIYCCTMNA